MPDKRITEDDVVAELRDGMTDRHRRLGLAAQADDPRARHRPIVAARPHDRELRRPRRRAAVRDRQGPKVVYAFVSLDSIPLEPHFRRRPTGRRGSTLELDEGMFLLGLQAAAWRVPFLPTRVGLGSDVLDRQPEIRTVVSPYDDGETFVAAPALRLDVALVHMNRGDAGGNGQYLDVDPYFDDLFCMAADRRFMSVEQVQDTDDLRSNGPVQTLQDQPADDRRGRRGADRRPLHRVRARLRPRRGVPEGVRGKREDGRGVGRVEGQVPRLRRPRPVPEGGRARRSTASDRVTRAEFCVVAVAECFRGDGEILANPIGTIPMIGGRVARRQLRTRPGDDRRRGDVRDRSVPGRGDRRGEGRRGVEPVPLDVRRGVVGPPSRDDGCLADRPVRQPEHRVHRAVGAAEGAAPRLPGCAGQHDQQHHVLLDPEPLAEGVRAEGRRRDRRRLRPGRRARPGGVALPRDPPRRHQPRRARLRDARPPHAPPLGAPRRDRRRDRRGDRLRAGRARRRGHHPRSRPPDELELIQRPSTRTGSGEPGGAPTP